MPNARLLDSSPYASITVDDGLVLQKGQNPQKVSPKAAEWLAVQHTRDVELTDAEPQLKKAAEVLAAIPRVEPPHDNPKEIQKIIDKVTQQN